MPKPTVIDIFCGAGGISEGFCQAGCEVLAAADLNKWALQTFAMAHPNSKTYCQSIDKIDWKKVLKELKIKKGSLDFLVGGPPCQAFSINNHQRGLHDKRSRLFRSYLSTVKVLQPKWIVLENVTGIFSAGDGKVVEQIKGSLQMLGYIVECRILKCVEFGIPQTRSRVVFIGNRIGKKNVWPIPTHTESSRYITVEQAIGDLPQLNNGEGKNESEYVQLPKCEYQRIIRKKSDQVFNHVAPNLSTKNLTRMSHIPQGGNWRNIPRRLLPPGMCRAKESDHTKRYGRLSPNGLASTILTKCDIHWGAYIHPDHNRSITVREAARFQSFPDRYRFFGPRSHQYVQVGNAVPPLLAKAIAIRLLSEYYVVKSIAIENSQPPSMAQ